MNRSFICAVFVMFLPFMTWCAEPQVEEAQPAVLRLGDEVLFGSVIYGDTAKFWETHTLIVGTIRESRQEYLPQGKLVCREHVGIRVDETVPKGRHGDQSLWRVTREQPVIARDVPADPPPPLYTAGMRILLLVDAEKGADDKVDFAVRSYAMMPNGSSEVLFLKGVDKRLIESTTKLCEALATDNPAQRVAKLGELLAGSVNPRERHVVRHSLEATIKTLESSLQDARQLRLKSE